MFKLIELKLLVFANIDGFIKKVQRKTYQCVRSLFYRRKDKMKIASVDTGLTGCHALLISICCRL